MNKFKYTEEELMSKILNEGYKFPISSSNDNLSNKKIDYKVLMLMTLLSNRKTEQDTCEDGKEELWRYLYRNKLIEYQGLVEETSKNKLKSIFKTIKKMENLDCNVIDVRKTDKNEIVYDINYSKNGKEYTTIETRIMQSLINTCNSNAIKIYIILRYKCRNGRRMLTQNWLIQQIGLSPKSKNNYQVITDITDMLHLCGYINKETKFTENKNSVNYYKVNSMSEWNRIRKERMK